MVEGGNQQISQKFLLVWTAQQYCLKSSVVTDQSYSYCRAGLNNNSGECHPNLMAFGKAIPPIQAIDGWGREPPILQEIFTCLDCSLILPQVICSCRSIRLILHGWVQQQLRWVPPKSHGIWGSHIPNPGQRWMREGTPNFPRNFTFLDCSLILPQIGRFIRLTLLCRAQQQFR